MTEPAYFLPQKIEKYVFICDLGFLNVILELVLFDQLKAFVQVDAPTASTGQKGKVFKQYSGTLHGRLPKILLEVFGIFSKTGGLFP